MLRLNRVFRKCLKNAEDYSDLMFLRYSLVLCIPCFQTKIQLKMEKLSSTTKGICDLEKFHHGAGSCTAPLFHTWPTAYFCK